MLGLILGGSGSGKSALAETLIVSYPSSHRYYIATMSASDEESKKRVIRHRKMREGKNFKTVECPTDLLHSAPELNGDILLECLSNLVANEMFLAGESRERTVQKVMDGIEDLHSRCEHVIVVSNNVFEDGISYPGETEDYLACLGELNRKLAERADLVIEAFSGMPSLLKGELPLCLKNITKESAGMKLVTGGAYQGKLSWACQKWQIDPEGTEVWNGEAGMPAGMDQIKILYGLHRILREIMNDEEALKQLKQMILSAHDLIVISDDLGCGLVPISAEERKWRETTGRFCEMLAAEASEVYRISCGLAQQLKGR